MHKKLILLLGSLFCFHTAYAEQLTDLLNNLKTYQADFSQTIQDTHGDTIQQSSGKMALQRPGHFRWDTVKPNQQLIIADGKSIWIYDKDLQEVTQKKQNENSQSPGLLLSDSVEHLSKRFSVTTTTKNDFILRPVKKDLFQSVELIFDNQGALTNMTLKDNLGQTTEITFSHIEVNKTLSSSLFKFHPPKDTDIVQG